MVTEQFKTSLKGVARAFAPKRSKRRIVWPSPRCIGAMSISTQMTAPRRDLEVTCHRKAWWTKCLDKIVATILLVAAMSCNAVAEEAADCAVEPATVALWINEAKGNGPPPWTDFQPSTKGEGYCSYYELGWRSFLYLMQTVPTSDGHVPRMLIWKRSDQIFPGNNGPTNSDSRAGHQPSPWSNTYNAPQTGPINKAGTLVDQAKPHFPLYTPNGQLTEFDVRTNRSLYTYLICQNLVTQACFDQRLERQHSDPIALPRNSLKNQGSVELKLAWLALDPMEAERCAEGSIFCIDGRDRHDRPAKLALVGLHIVVYHESVPSGIWMTLEHHANAPNCDGGSELNGLPHWTFSDAPADASTWHCKSASFLAKSGADSSQACRLNGDGHTIGPSGERVCNCRGSDTGTNLPPDSDPSPTFVCRTTRLANQAKSLNESVSKALSAQSETFGELSNYQLIGALWIDPHDSKNSSAQGSLGLTNTTMETYIQTYLSAPLNCFGCHNSEHGVTRNTDPSLKAFRSPHGVNGADRSLIFNLIKTSTAGQCPPTSSIPSWCPK